MASGAEIDILEGYLGMALWTKKTFGGYGVHAKKNFGDSAPTN